MDLCQLSQSKYCKEACRPDHRLRILIGHAAFYASVQKHRSNKGDSTDDEESKQENDFEGTLARSINSNATTTVVPLASRETEISVCELDDDDDSETDSDTSSEEDDEDVFNWNECDVDANGLTIPLSRSAVLSEPSTTTSVSDSEWSEGGDENETERYKSSGFILTHSPPQRIGKPMKFRSVSRPPLAEYSFYHPPDHDPGTAIVKLVSPPLPAPSVFSTTTYHIQDSGELNLSPSIVQKSPSKSEFEHLELRADPLAIGASGTRTSSPTTQLKAEASFLQIPRSVIARHATTTSMLLSIAMSSIAESTLLHTLRLSPSFTRLGRWMDGVGKCLSTP